MRVVTLVKYVLTFVCMLFLTMPGNGFSGEPGAGSSTALPPAMPVEAASGVQTPESPLLRALEQSEADKAALEKRFNELSSREIRAREEAARLAAEKEALEKTCPPKDTAKAPSKPVNTFKNKKPARKWWTSGAKTSDHSASTGSESVKKSKSKKSAKTLKKKHGAANQTADRKMSCTGPVVSLNAVKKAMAGGKNLAGKNLSRLNLTGMTLTGANLRGACLEKTVMERADLAEADLERAELSGANLTRASLRLANINAANLDGTLLDHAIWTDSRVCLEGSVGRCRDVIQ